LTSVSPTVPYISLHRISLHSLPFFFNHTATTEIYTLSLHDALPISRGPRSVLRRPRAHLPRRDRRARAGRLRLPAARRHRARVRSEEHTSELQSLTNLVCRLLLEKKKGNPARHRCDRPRVILARTTT